LESELVLSKGEARREVMMYLRHPLTASAGLMGWEELREWRRMEEDDRRQGKRGEGRAARTERDNQEWWEKAASFGRIPPCYVMYLEEKRREGAKGEA